MKILSELRAKWKEKTLAEKLKLVLEGICDLGMDLLVGYANIRLIPSDTPKWKRAACVVASGGLAAGLGKMASNSLNEMVDVIFTQNQEDEEDDE